MQKFVALFSVPAATMQEWAAATDEATRKEQMDKMMADWDSWAAANAANIVDRGLPLGKTKRVTKDGVTDVTNDLNYMMVIQADSHEAAAQLLTGNPHLLMIPNSSVDVMGTMGPAAE